MIPFPKNIAEILNWAQKVSAELNSKLAAIRSSDDVLDGVGRVSCYAGDLLPSDFKECNGQLLKRKDYPALFKQIGTKFNTGGEPLDVFRLPNFTSYGYPGAYVVIKATGRRGLEVPQGPTGSGGGGGGSGVTDHGLLTGLTDDDHSQYHNDTRGDARYSQLGHGHTASAISGFNTAADARVSAGITTHEGALDPHPQYLTESEEVVVDFTAPTASEFFDVALTGALVGQKVLATVSLKMPSGVDEDEIDCDPLTVSGYVTTADQVRLHVATVNGDLIYGQRTINVTIS